MSVINSLNSNTSLDTTSLTINELSRNIIFLVCSKKTQKMSFQSKKRKLNFFTRHFEKYFCVKHSLRSIIAIAVRLIVFLENTIQNNICCT